MTLSSIKPGLRAAGDLPTHPTLTHPLTGAPIRALGFRRDGRVIWPGIGGAPDDGGGSQDGSPGGKSGDGSGKPASGGDEPLGEPGKKALQAERERADAEARARKEMEKQLAELTPLASLKPLADLLGGKATGDGKTDLEKLTERLGKHEEELAAGRKELEAERVARWRAEVQADKKLTAAQAARLVGATKEELEADADALLEAFGGRQDDGEDGKGRRRTPRPDPAQGARPGEKASSLDAGRSLYAERHKKKTTTTG